MSNSETTFGKWLAAMAIIGGGLSLTSAAAADVTLVEKDGWTISTNGRVNAFVSHVWGDTRPAGLESLNWVGFNEATDRTEVSPDDKIQKTRIRSGYVPSNFALMAGKQISPNLKVLARVEIGIQITTLAPSAVGDPTWMQPRDVYLDLSGRWGGVRAGRAFGLFGRGNLFMNYELGHAYGLGFPCSYTTIFGGACGHVGFGTIYPDHRAQITYSTPKVADVVQLSVGVFDPRTMPTKGFVQTPLPRAEAELTADYHPKKGWGVKAWANAMWQRVSTTGEITDPVTMQERKETFSLDAKAFGAGLQGDIGPLQVGATGHIGEGMDGFIIFPFNPILASLAPAEAHEAKFRQTKAYLIQAAGHFTPDAWLSLGFGQSLFDRTEGDPDITTLDQAPLLRRQTGISAGFYYRLTNVVLGLDYFRASYGFDDRSITPPPEAPPGTTYAVVSSQQTVQVVNAGVTLEW